MKLPPSLPDAPAIIAHRGASALAPENTFAAFDLALERGVDGLETDLRISRDGTAFCIHDATLDRTTNGHGRVDERSDSELAALDAGGWFDPHFAGQRLPTLAAFLDRYAHRVPLHIELKSPGVVAEVVQRIGRLGAGGRIELSSFDPAMLVQLAAMLPAVPRCLLVDRWRLPEPHLHAAAIGAPARELDAQRIAAAHAHGLKVRAWAIEARADVARLRAIRADELTLDDPAWGR